MSANPIRYESKVIALNALSDRGYELVLDRAGMSFQAGKEIMLHGAEPTDDRQYSIASGEQDEHLHLLFRLIPDGALTPQLVGWKPGDACAFTGPFGSFLLRDFLAPIVFVATGTGIAPAVSFAKTYEGLEMTVLHGVREEADLMGRALFENGAYHPCVTQQDDTVFFKGRVTAKLKDMELPDDAHYYLCGANDMILEVRGLLKGRGVADDCIFSEAYYFW